MDTRAWQSMQANLAPNPAAALGRSYVWGGMVATLIAAVFLLTGSWFLLGLTEPPISVESLTRQSTWMVILEVVCLRMTWNVVSHGNNLFLVSPRLGWVSVSSGAIAFVLVFLALLRDLRALPHSGGVLEGEFTWRTAVLVGVLLCGLHLLRQGNSLFAASKRLLTRTVRRPGDLADVDYSLYLRTFDEDHRLSGVQRFSPIKRALRSLFIVEMSEEELLIDALSRMDATMVTVGKPGEVVPHIGAWRVYLPLEDWQAPVRRFMRGARHVVLVLGWGAGTLWELAEAMRVLPPERLVLVVTMGREEYERFRVEAAGTVRAHAARHPRDDGEEWTPPALPAHAGDGDIPSPVRALIHFSPGWQGHFVPVRRYSPIHNSLRIAVTRAAHPAFVRLGYPPRGPLRLVPVDTVR
ncbi:hypothetical protein ACIQMJ_37080 [Actinosynnema sp. NPDC091369]